MSAAPYIDFAAPQGPLGRHRYLAGWGFLTLAVAVTVLTIGWKVILDREIQAQTAQIDNLRRGPGSAPASLRQTATAAQTAEVESVNRVIRRLSVPWGRLFQAVESAKSTRVFILSIKPDIQQGELRLAGEADGFSAITEFTVALARQPVLARVRLLSHEIAPSGQVRFDISAQWQP